MRNLLDERPRDYEALHGRCRACCDAATAADLRGRDVIDVGCGFGWFERYALRHSPRRILALEPRAADLATPRAAVADPRVVFAEGSALDLPSPDGSADMIVCWDVIEHLPRRSEPRFFGECRRVLRPGGVLLLSTPFRSLRATLTDPAWWLIGHRHYTAQHLAELAAPAGLRLEHATVRGAGADLLALWNLYLSKWLLRRPPLAAAWFDRHTDAEYARDGGYMTLFVRFKRP